MSKTAPKKTPQRRRKGSLFTLANESKMELERRAKATSVPMARILDRLILSDKLSDEAEKVLSEYSIRNGVSREAALNEAVLQFRKALERPKQ